MCPAEQSAGHLAAADPCANLTSVPALTTDGLHKTEGFSVACRKGVHVTAIGTKTSQPPAGYPCIATAPGTGSGGIFLRQGMVRTSHRLFLTLLLIAMFRSLVQSDTPKVVANPNSMSDEHLHPRPPSLLQYSHQASARRTELVTKAKLARGSLVRDETNSRQTKGAL